MDHLKFKKGDIIISKRQGKKGFRIYKVLDIVISQGYRCYRTYNYITKNEHCLRVKAGKKYKYFGDKIDDELIKLLYAGH